MTIQTAYDFDSIITDDDGNSIFSDSYLSGYRAKVIAATMPQDSHTEIVTMVVRFPRCILPEMNTHRVFSRNSASSRARSIHSTINSVLDDYYVPLFTHNKPGMSGEFLVGKNYEKAALAWDDARMSAIESAVKLVLGENYNKGLTVTENLWNYKNRIYRTEKDSGSVHKQNANRLIEPFLFHEMIITSTRWSNFFKLRLDQEHAQPEMFAIAKLMHHAIENASPNKSETHVPFAQGENDNSDFEATKNRVAEAVCSCARISYVSPGQGRKLDEVEFVERLLDDHHMSPFEHSAIYIPEDLRENIAPGNLHGGWVSYRQLIDSGAGSLDKLTELVQDPKRISQLS